MPSKDIILRCFIIGPMKNMARLHKLRDEIIKPILTPYGYKVITPDEGEIGNIMRQVLLNLEQADLLIADITGNNPNVMYELGVYHSFGKPYLVVKDNSFKETLPDTPFDIDAYRFHEINFNNLEVSQQRLKSLLENIIRKIDVWDWFSNPVTDFYQAPVAEIPTAVGLSKNYKQNFLKMILPHVFQKNEKGDGFKIEVWVGTDKTDDSGKVKMRELTKEERNRLKVEIRIPKKMSIANHDFIIGLKNMGKLDLKSAEVGRRTRPFNMYFKNDEKGNLSLVDIPTILDTLNESIMQRRKLHEDQIDSEDWEILEQQELERFANKCELFKKDMEAHHPEVKGRIDIIRGWDYEI